MDFAFNASALGAGGIIERGNVVYTIPSLASVALAPTGGEWRSVVSNYFSEELAIGHAETRVYGRSMGQGKARTFTTSTYVLMKDVSIFGRIRIGEMSSTVTSTRGFEESDDHAFDISIRFEHVTIDGKPVRPLIDNRLAALTRYEDLRKALGTPRRPPAAIAADTGIAGSFNTTPENLRTLLDQRRPVQTSMIGSVEGLEPFPEPRTYPVPGLGTVRFAELMLKPGRRRLNLVRVKLGPLRRMSEEGPEELMSLREGPFDENNGTPLTGGSITLGSGEGNGTPIGP